MDELAVVQRRRPRGAYRSDLYIGGDRCFSVTALRVTTFRD
jgi:hypothetical protein